MTEKLQWSDYLPMNKATPDFDWSVLPQTPVGKPLPMVKAVKLCEQAADALNQAREKGVFVVGDQSAWWYSCCPLSPKEYNELMAGPLGRFEMDQKARLAAGDDSGHRQLLQKFAQLVGVPPAPSDAGSDRFTR